MANNLFISYDLNSPRQDYEAVIEEIKHLGSWAKVQKSYWYVNTNSSAEEAAKRVWAKMDNNDSLIVVDTTNNDACWFGLSDEVSKHIQDQWRK